MADTADTAAGFRIAGRAWAMNKTAKRSSPRRSIRLTIVFGAISTATTRNLGAIRSNNWPGDARESTEGLGWFGGPGERGLKYCPSTRYADPV
jgi:hypothetical protein